MGRERFPDLVLGKVPRDLVLEIKSYYVKLCFWLVQIYLKCSTVKAYYTYILV